MADEKGVSEQDIRAYINTMPEMQRNFVRSPTGRQQRDFSRCKQYRLELMRVWQMGAMERIVRRQAELNDQRRARAIKDKGTGKKSRSGKPLSGIRKKPDKWSYKSSHRVAGDGGNAVSRSLARGGGWLQELASRVSNKVSSCLGNSSAATAEPDESSVRMVRFEGTPPRKMPARKDVYYNESGARVTEQTIEKAAGRKVVYRKDTDFELRLATDRETVKVVRSDDPLTETEAAAEASHIREHQDFSKKYKASERDLRMFTRSNERTEAVRWYEVVTGGLVDTAGYDINGKEVDGWGRSLACDSGLVQELYRRICRDSCGDYIVEYTDLPSPLFRPPGSRKPSYQHQIVEKSPPISFSSESSRTGGSSSQYDSSTGSSGFGRNSSDTNSSHSKVAHSSGDDEVFKSPGRFPRLDQPDSCEHCGFPVGCNCEDGNDGDGSNDSVDDNEDANVLVLKGKMETVDNNYTVSMGMVKLMLKQHSEESTRGKPLGNSAITDGGKEATGKGEDKSNTTAAKNDDKDTGTDKKVSEGENSSRNEETKDIHDETVMEIETVPEKEQSGQAPTVQQQPDMEDGILDVDDDGEEDNEVAPVGGDKDEGFDEIRCAFIALNTEPPHGNNDVEIVEGFPCPSCPADCVGNPCTCNHYGMDAQGFTGRLHHGFEFTTTNSWLSVKCTHSGCEKQEPHTNEFRQRSGPVSYYTKDNIVTEKDFKFLSGVGDNWTCNQPAPAAAAQNEERQENGEEPITIENLSLTDAEDEDDDMEVEEEGSEESETSELGEEGEELDQNEKVGDSAGDALEEEELGAGAEDKIRDKNETVAPKQAGETEKDFLDEKTLDSKTSDYLRTIGTTADWLRDYPKERGDWRQSSCVRCDEPFIATNPEEQVDLARVGMHDAGLATWRGSSCCHDIHKKCMQEWIFIREHVKKEFICCPVCNEICTIVGVYTAAAELHPAAELEAWMSN